jgi:trimeric autotransporter adhesin
MRATGSCSWAAALRKSVIGSQLGLSASLLAGALVVVLSLAPVASATLAPPSPVPESSWVANGPVTDAAWSGHTLYIGGMFTRIGPPTGPFAILSGTTGAQQGSGPVVAGGEATVETIISDGSGGWYVGGNFTSVGGTSIRNLAHITASGTLDTAFEPNPDSTVRALVLALGGGTLYAAGDFTQIGGQDRSELAAVSTSSGVALPGLLPGFGHGFEFVPNVHGVALALAPSTNTLYAAAENDGTGESELKAFNTSTGQLESSFTAEVKGAQALAVSLDAQTLYIGGVSSIGGQARNGLGAVNATTGAVTSFNPPGSSAYPAEVLELTADGTTLYAGGLDGLQKISTATGTVNASFKPVIGEVVAFALSSDQTKLYVSGASPVFVSGNQAEVKELNAITGAAESSFSTQPNGSPSVVAVSSTGTVAIGGGRRVAIEVEPYTSLGGVERNGFAAIDEITGQPTSLRLDYGSRFVVSPDGSSLYAIAPKAGITKLIRVDTATGVTSSAFSAELHGYVVALAISPDGSTLYVGGVFNEVNGHTAHYLAALNTSDGSLKTGFSPTVSGEKCGILFGYPIDSLTVSHDGTILYIGGAFTELDGQLIAHLAAVHTADGSLDGAFAPNLPSSTTTCEDVFATVLNPPGNLLYVGGTYLGGVHAYDAATGTRSTTFGAPGDTPALALSLDGSTLYLGGEDHGAVNAATGEAVTAFNPAMPLRTGMDALAFGPDGALAVGGYFTDIDRVPVGGFAIFPPSNGSPANGYLPEIATDIERSFLSASAGTWAGAQPLSFQYQWLRDGVAIPGATSNTYYFTGADWGHRLNVEVTATNGNGQVSATSFPYYRVLHPSAPINIEPPQISGGPTVGGTLTASPGSWAGTEPLTYSYQWLRDGVAIPGATGATYVISSADAGHELAMWVTVTNSVGESSATSAGVKVPVPPGGNQGNGGSGSSSAGGTTTSGSNGQTSQSGPSPAAIQAALAATLSFKGSSPTISALLKTGSYSLSFTAPGAGILTIQWTSTNAQASKHTKRRAKPVVVASGSGTFSSSERGTVKLHLTAVGRKLLKKSKVLSVVEVATFKPSRGSAQTKRVTLTIRAGKKTRHR